ncbi:unnamed protein product [Rotaria sp. Silwood1]|nr:unnamed protein product [Rotaria sp. Silwood1]
MMNSSIELNTSALDQSLPSWFAPDSKIGSIVDRLMVEEWMNITSHKAYYDRCQPITFPSPEWTQNDPRSNCPSLPHRPIVICDITTDKGCSIEIVQQITSIDYPFLLRHTKTNASAQR